MTLTDLQATLQQYLQERTFTLPDNAIGAAEVREALAAYWPDQQLVMQNATLTVSATNVTVIGQITLPALGAIDATAVFYPAAGGLPFTLTIALPATWRFSQSFPALQGT